MVDRHLEAAELRTLAYIGANATALSASVDVDELADAETIVLNDACNSAFDAALDRVALVESVCRASLQVTAPHLYLACVQLFIAALLHASSAARASGYGEEFVRLAHELRRATPPHPRPAASSAAELSAREYVELTGVRFFSPVMHGIGPPPQQQQQQQHHRRSLAQSSPL